MQVFKYLKELLSTSSYYHSYNRPFTIKGNFRKAVKKAAHTQKNAIGNS